MPSWSNTFARQPGSIRGPHRASNMQGEPSEPAVDPPEVLERFNAELSLAETIAKHMARSIGGAVPFDDLLSAAREGLFDAARKFDTSRQVPFGAYANSRIRGAIVDSLRKMGPLPRSLYARISAYEAVDALSQVEAQAAFRKNNGAAEPAAAEKRLNDHLADLATAAVMGFAKDSPDSVADAASELLNPEEALAQAELFDQMRQLIDKLPQDYACVIRYYYFENRSLEVTAEKMQMSVSWACRVHARAIAALGKLLKESS